MTLVALSVLGPQGKELPQLYTSVGLGAIENAVARHRVWRARFRTLGALHRRRDRGRIHVAGAAADIRLKIQLRRPRPP